MREAEREEGREKEGRRIFRNARKLNDTERKKEKKVGREGREWQMEGMLGRSSYIEKKRGRGKREGHEGKLRKYVIKEGDKRSG